MKTLNKNYEKIKRKMSMLKQKWQFVINSEDKSRLLNVSLDVMSFGGKTEYKVANQFIIGVDNENKNFYVFCEQNFDIVGYAIYKLPFSRIDGIGEIDGDGNWLKITEHRPETIEKKIKKVVHYIEKNKNKEEAKDIRMYQEWKKESEKISKR